MKKSITLFRLLLAAGLILIGFAEKAQASHAQGADLTYVNVAPNTYVIQYKLYRDCTGITVGNTQMISYRAPGCNATNRTLNLQMVGKIVGTPYCGPINLICDPSPSAPPNFEEITYTGTLALPSQCSNWIVSARIGNRNNSRNLVGGSSQWLFTDALINNVVTQTNNSPRFGSLPVFYVPVHQQININHNVTDLDGDSLVYSLVPGLDDLGIPVTYGSYQAGTSPAPYNTSYPAGVFSALNPIISQTPVTINSFTGNISFMPLAFEGNAFPTVQGMDKYVMAVQIDEYRKVNGQAVKIGHVKRDILITVQNPKLNQVPYLDSLIVNGLRYSPDSVLETGFGQPFEIRIPAKDKDPMEVVRITSNALMVIPGSNFTVTGGRWPVATFTFTPSALHVRTVPYTFNVTLRDNACPQPGQIVKTISFRVINSGPLGTFKTLPANSFTAYPNPAADVVTFKIKPDYSVKNAEVVITNVTGSVVDRIKVKAGEEHIRWNKKADLPAGIYFARFTSDAGSQTIKLIHLQ